jgi:hypothetical protein
MLLETGDNNVAHPIRSDAHGREMIQSAPTLDDDVAMTRSQSTPDRLPYAIMPCALLLSIINGAARTKHGGMSVGLASPPL